MEFLNSILWSIATVFILFSSIYFSFRLKFIQLNLKKLLNKDIFNRNNKQALWMSLGGRIGVGSISGVALAIYLGGPGVIFWMWIFGILVTVNAFTESYLSVKYKQKNSNGVSCGGPFYYLKRIYKGNIFANLYVLIIIFSYLFGFIPIQTNTISKSVNLFFDLPFYFIVIIIVLLVFYILNKNDGFIKKINYYIVPFMTMSYILIAAIPIIFHYDLFVNSLQKIVINAFNFKSFFVSFLPVVIIGMQRGIFSNEAGLGTGAISAASTNNKPINQGFIQIIGVYITTVLVASSTAFLVLMSDASLFVKNDINGIEMAMYAYNYFFGNYGSLLLIIFIVLFSFSTIVTGLYILRVSFGFLHISNNIIKLLIVITSFFGAIVSPNFLWQLINTLTSLLAIINIYGLFSLRKEIIKDLKNVIK